MEVDTVKKVKVEMTAEQKAEKELRTVFVGNLPVEVIEKVHTTFLSQKTFFFT